MAARSGKPRIGILFAQFAAYHVDRCAAAARRLGERAEVVAVEVASASETYAWEVSGEVPGAVKRVLFPGERYERIGWARRLRAQLEALATCDTVFVGIGYDQPDIPALAALLRSRGVRMIVMSESKHDDFPRRRWREAVKRVVLRPFAAALVGGPRQVAYFRALGFVSRPVLSGYDAVSLDRVRGEGGDPELAPEQRPFVFVGRFVAKKNIAVLVEAFARYRAAGGARRLVLVGGGELEGEVNAALAAAGLGALVEVTGFVGSAEVARRLANARALLLPSRIEQWGLVVNEALAFGLPVAVSTAVGAADRLVRDRENGFILPPDDAGAWALAMHALDDDARWAAMVAVSRELAPLGDVACFADAVERLSGV